MENLKLEGTYTIVKNKTEVFTVKNLITAVGAAALLQKIGDVVDTVGLQYVALGTTDTAAVVSDTQLASESFRKPPGAVAVLSNVLTLTQTLEETETNGITIREIGVFGIDATIADNSGTLISRAVLGTPITKVAGDIIDITWALTLT